MNYKELRAFTLAETFITLSILGVIAALTIPAINLYIQKSEYSSGMKKAYATLTNAIAQMNFENQVAGYPKYWTDDNVFWADLSKQLRTMNICSNGQMGCFTELPLKALNGTNIGTYDGKNYTLRTADGYSYQYTPGAITANTYGIEEKDAQMAFGTFLVDVNGNKRPNTVGRDLFYFVYIEDKGIIPAGFYDHTNCNKEGTGYACAGRIMKETKMKY